MERMVYTPNEVATLLHVRLATVYDLIKSGELPALKMGKNYKIPKAQLETWIADTMSEQTEERRKYDTSR